MSDFFGTLETELRAAAERPARRAVPFPAIVVAVLLALALAPIVLVLGSGSAENGSVGPPVKVGQSLDTRPADTTMVTTGVAPVAGRWQLETFVHDGHTCLGLYLPEGDPETRQWFSPFCPVPDGQSLPSFAAQATWFPHRNPEEHLVYGWTPEEGTAVELTEDGAVLERVETVEGPGDVDRDFFMMILPDEGVEGHLRWVREDGRVGGTEIRFAIP
jgi:hypothetical protein